MSLSELADAIELERGGAVAGSGAMGSRELSVVRRAARAHREATQRRDAAIVAAIAAGDSLRDVGEAADLSHSGVRKIVDRWRSSSSEVVDHG